MLLYRLLQLAQVDLVPVDVVGQGLVQRDQVLQVDAQDRHLEAAALVVEAPVVDVVAARGEQLRHLAQGLGEENVNEKLLSRLYRSLFR